jgi:hypothetical protein
MLEVLEDRLVPGSVLNPYTLSMTCLDDSGGAPAEASLVGASGEEASPAPGDSGPADSSATSSSVTFLPDSSASSAAGDTSNPAPANAPDSVTLGDAPGLGDFAPAAPAPATSAPPMGGPANPITGPVASAAGGLAAGAAGSSAGTSASAPVLISPMAASVGDILPPIPAPASAPGHGATPPSAPGAAGSGGISSQPAGSGVGQTIPGLPSTVFVPSQIRTAYGINLLPAANQGQGVTIGIVDELIDPTIVGDVQQFSAAFGLPQLDGVGGDGTFTQINDTALGVPGVSPPNGTSIETALDVEWAHSMAPKANIVLVYVPATGTLFNQFNQICHGMQFAASQPNVVAVSTSYGFFENNTVRGPNTFVGGLTTAQETNLDSTYLATGAATNVAMTVSSGDYSLQLFPAVSPNVIAVGGTSLYTISARGRYWYELGWGGVFGSGAGGGGVSMAFNTPAAFQANNGVNFAGRAIPDVSMVADPNTGVAVYSANDAPVNGGDPWFQIGGTSLASPLFAGVVALAQQNRIAATKPILNSVGVNTVLYSTYNSANYSTYFHDVTLGNNNDIAESRFNGSPDIAGFNAGTGYDLATGIGSPIGNQLVTLLSSAP